MDSVAISIIAVQTVMWLVVLAAVLTRRPAAKTKSHTGVDAQEPAVPKLSAEDLARLQQAAEAAFQKAVDEGAKTFSTDLASTSEQLSKLIVRITTDVVERELEQYRQSLAKAREQALDSLAKMQAAVEQKQRDLETDMDAEMAKRRAYLMERLDKSLGAAVAAYIVESLGMEADLGAQQAYLLENLERHKKELKQELSGGDSPR